MENNQNVVKQNRLNHLNNKCTPIPDKNTSGLMEYNEKRSKLLKRINSLQQKKIITTFIQNKPSEKEESLNSNIQSNSHNNFYNDYEIIEHAVVNENKNNIYLKKRNSNNNINNKKVPNSNNMTKSKLSNNNNSRINQNDQKPILKKAKKMMRGKLAVNRSVESIAFNPSKEIIIDDNKSIHKEKNNNINNRSVIHINKNLSFIRPKKKSIILALDSNSESKKVKHNINITESLHQQIHYFKKNSYNNILISPNLKSNNNLKGKSIANSNKHIRYSAEDLMHIEPIKKQRNISIMQDYNDSNSMKEKTIEVENYGLITSKTLANKEVKAIKVSLKKSRSFVKSSNNTSKNNTLNENSKIPSRSNLKNNYIHTKGKTFIVNDDINSDYYLKGGQKKRNSKLTTYENRKNKTKDSYTKRKNRLNSVEITNIDKKLELNISKEINDQEKYKKIKDADLNKFKFLMKKLNFKNVLKTLKHLNNNNNSNSINNSNNNSKKLITKKIDKKESKKIYKNVPPLTARPKALFNNNNNQNKNQNNQNNSIIMKTARPKKRIGDKGNSSSMQNLRNNKINMYLNSSQNTCDTNKLSKQFLPPLKEVSSTRKRGLKSISLEKNNNSFINDSSFISRKSEKLNEKIVLKKYINKNISNSTYGERKIKIKRNSFYNRKKNTNDEFNLTLLDEQKNYENIDECNNNNIKSIETTKRTPITKLVKKDKIFSLNMNNSLDSKTLLTLENKDQIKSMEVDENKINYNNYNNNNDLVKKDSKNQTKYANKYINITKRKSPNFIDKTDINNNNNLTKSTKYSRNTVKNFNHAKNKSFIVSQSLKTKTPRTKRELFVHKKIQKNSNQKEIQNYSVEKRKFSCPNDNIISNNLDNLLNISNSNNNKKDLDNSKLKDYLSNSSLYIDNEENVSLKSIDLLDKDDNNMLKSKYKNKSAKIYDMEKASSENSINKKKYNSKSLVDYNDDHKHVDSFKNNHMDDNNNNNSTKTKKEEQQKNITPYIIKKNIEKFEQPYYNYVKNNNNSTKENNIKHSVICNKSIKNNTNVGNERNTGKKSKNFRKEISKNINNEINLKFDSNVEKEDNSCKNNMNQEYNNINNHQYINNNIIKEKKIPSNININVEINEIYSQIYQVMDNQSSKKQSNKNKVINIPINSNSSIYTNQKGKKQNLENELNINEIFKQNPNFNFQKILELLKDDKAKVEDCEDEISSSPTYNMEINVTSRIGGSHNDTQKNCLDKTYIYNKSTNTDIKVCCNSSKTENKKPLLNKNALAHGNNNNNNSNIINNLTKKNLIFEEKDNGIKKRKNDSNTISSSNSNNVDKTTYKGTPYSYQQSNNNSNNSCRNNDILGKNKNNTLPIKSNFDINKDKINKYNDDIDDILNDSYLDNDSSFDSHNANEKNQYIEFLENLNKIKSITNEAKEIEKNMNLFIKKINTNKLFSKIN